VALAPVEALALVEPLVWVASAWGLGPGPVGGCQASPRDLQKADQ
jgi:hypothetical protein